jgi:hypothetical protein
MMKKIRNPKSEFRTVEFEIVKSSASQSLILSSAFFWEKGPPLFNQGTAFLSTQDLYA